MTNRLLISIAPPAVVLLLTSCSFAPNCGNSHPYKNYAASGPIKAPAGVTVPHPDAAYQIPAAGTAATTVAAPAATTSVDPCLVTPPSVLTGQDMAKPGNPAPAKAAAAPAAATKPPATPVPAAATKPPASPAPASASHPRPVAGTGGME